MTHDTLTPHEIASRLEARAAELTASAESGIRIAAALRSSEDVDGRPVTPELLERARAWLADGRPWR